MDSIGGYQFEERTFCSLLSEAKPVVEQILEQVHGCGWSERELFAIHLALEEALTNALKHGNQWDPQKRVTVRWQVTHERFWIQISDEGRGFDPETVPDPTLDENLEQPSGRGLMLMRSYMDVVSFNREGNSVAMVKFRKQKQ